MVGEEGFVVGVDMTDEQLDMARSYQDHHRQAFGYRASNVAFQKGYIENLEDLPLDPGSFDVIVSNCVVNLATDKQAVLRGAYDFLKPGGEMNSLMSMQIVACQKLWRVMRCSTANACLARCIGTIF
jgi:SAM-dependent methyltransferase